MKTSRLLAFVAVAGIAGVLFLGSTCGLLNKPPSVPEISGPTTGIVGVPVTFTATATDPEGDSIAFQFAWGDGDTSDWSALFASGETTAMSHTYADTGSYGATARAQDASGATSDWMNSTTLRVLSDGVGLPDTVLARIAVSTSSFHLALAPNSRYLYVSHRSHSLLSVVDVELGVVLRTITVGSGAHDVAATPTGDFVLATCIGDSSLHIANSTGDTTATRLHVGQNPLGVAVGPAGTIAYVTVASPPMLAVVDIPSGQVVDSMLTTGYPSDVVVDSTGELLYMADADGDRVLVVSTASLSVLATIPVGAAPNALALGLGGLLYVACKGDSSVFAVRTSDYRVVVEARLPKGPDDIVAMPRGDFVAVSDAYGIHYLLSPTLSVVDSVRGGSTPKGLAVDPAGDRLYLACHDYIYVIGRRGEGRGCHVEGVLP